MRSGASRSIEWPSRMTAKDGSRGKRIWRQSLLLDLAAYFAARPGQIVASRTLLEEVWGEVWDRRPVKVAVAILRLRRARGPRIRSASSAGRATVTGCSRRPH